MTYHTPSALPADGRISPSLANALAALESWPDLDPTQIRDRRSALHGIADLLGKPLAAIPCDIPWLNAHLFGPTPTVRPLNPGRKRNIETGLRGVLRRMGLHEADPRWDPRPVSPAWQALVSEVRMEAARGCLRGFARYLTERGIEPSEVDDEAVAAWAAESAQRCLGTRRENRAEAVAVAWNALLARGLGEGLRPLAAPARRKPYVLPVTAFPQSFQDDLARFERRLAGGGRTGGRFTAGDGPRRPLKPKAVATRIFSLLQAASALVILGIVRPEELLTLRDLLKPLDRAGAILDFFAAKTARETGGQLAVIAAALRIVGTHHAKLDHASVDQLKAWCDQTGHRRQDGMTPMVRERLRALIQPRHRALLLGLPGELMARARAAPPGEVEAARMARMAAIIEVLLICPMRADNLRHLRADTHFRRLDPKGQRVTHIVVAGADVKNREPIEWPVPRESAELIETYLRDFRPALADPRNPFLFPGEKLAAYSAGALGTALGKTVYAEVGVRVHPHLFRHFTAWMHLQHYPGAYEDVRRMLGHRSLQTTINAYVGFETAAAAERFDTVVLEERKAGRTLVAQAWGGHRRPKGPAGKGVRP